ncbi:unnamed protein product, partial [Musa textilis]
MWYLLVWPAVRMSTKPSWVIQVRYRGYCCLLVTAVMGFTTWYRPSNGFVPVTIPGSLVTFAKDTPTSFKPFASLT